MQAMKRLHIEPGKLCELERCRPILTDSHIPAAVRAYTLSRWYCGSSQRSSAILHWRRAADCRHEADPQEAEQDFGAQLPEWKASLYFP